MNINKILHTILVYISVYDSLFYSLLIYLTMISGGDKRDRTADLLRARQALSQLSYIPISS